MSQSVRIFILDNSFTFGGAINSLCYLVRALDKSKFSPVVVSGQSQKYLNKNLIDCRFYHYVPKLKWINNKFYKRFARLPLFSNHLLLKILMNITRHIYWLVFITFPEALKYYHLGKRHKVALIHLNNIMGSQFAGILAAKFLRIPCIAHLRDFEEIHPITRFYARLIDHHVAISESIKNNLLQLGVSSDRITIVHDAIDLKKFRDNIRNEHLLSEFGLLPEHLRFGIFGRVVEWKGIREFILAARLVIEEIPEARAYVIGGISDGDEGYLQNMKQLVDDLELKGKIVFTGFRHDVPAMMSLMDVVVHASKRAEPFGMVLIEAMAMKKPVIATRGGGPVDIVVDGETGFLVEMGNVESLSQAVIMLLQKPDLREKMGMAGRALVECKFSSERYALQMEEIYQHYAGS
jgi:glycosyltransferase involved in cell wall biosynthesis